MIGDSLVLEFRGNFTLLTFDVHSIIYFFFTLQVVLISQIRIVLCFSNHGKYLNFMQLN